MVIQHCWQEARANNTAVILSSSMFIIVTDATSQATTGSRPKPVLFILRARMPPKSAPVRAVLYTGSRITSPPRAIPPHTHPIHPAGPYLLRQQSRHVPRRSQRFLCPLSRCRRFGAGICSVAATKLWFAVVSVWGLCGTKWCCCRFVRLFVLGFCRYCLYECA